MPKPRSRSRSMSRSSGSDTASASTASSASALAARGVGDLRDNKKKKSGISKTETTEKTHSKKKEKHKKADKKRHREASEDDDDDDSDHGDQGPAAKKRKSKKKEKKSSKKKDKKAKKGKNRAAAPSDSDGAASEADETPFDATRWDTPELRRARNGAAPVDPRADYYLRSAEFIVWLKDTKHKFLSDLSTRRSHRYFRDFAELWNRGALDARFYRNEVTTTAMASNERTGYRWKFAALSEAETNQLYDAKDSVYGMTASSKVLNEVKKPTVQGRPGTVDSPTNANAIPVRGAASAPPADTASTSAAAILAGLPPSELAAMDAEDRSRYVAQRQRQERRHERQRREADLDELAPRPSTAREAAQERRRATAAFHRANADRDLDAELPDSELTGGGGFAEALARERRRTAAADERRAGRRVAVEERAAQHRAKEDATMAMLRQLAAQRH
ncbi:hypothetical protein HK405_012229, partial [Cladochytrium tenue]